MVRPKKSLMREVAKYSLQRRGFKVEIQTGQGILTGARLSLFKDGESYRASVRTSYERSVSLSRQMNGQWRVLPSVDFVLVVAPEEKNSSAFQVLAFDASKLKSFFDKALKQIERAGLSSSFEMPIFVPLDETTRKNVGHRVAGIKEGALWSTRVTEAELKTEMSSEFAKETFIDRVKREFAEKNEVDVSKVVVEFRILT